MISAHVENGALHIIHNAHQILRAAAEVRLTDGRVLSSREQPGALAWQLETDASIGVRVRLHYKNLESSAERVEQLRPLVAERGYRNLPLERLRIRQTGWQSWSRSHPPAPLEPNQLVSAPPIRGPWLPHRRADSQVEAWMTTLQTEDEPALLLGFVSAHSQLGSVEIAPSGDEGHSLVAATELEGVLLAPGDEVASEPLLIAVGDEAELVEAYATRVARAMGAQPSAAHTSKARSWHPADERRNDKNIPTGWCSWYQLKTNVSQADVVRNLESLASRQDLLPLRLILLDDGYEREVGDWLELNDRFPDGLRALVATIHAQGYLAGLWLAPFLLSARSRTFADHPAWVVRDDHGAPLKAIDNWGSANYALDTTRPAAMAWLEHVIHTACDEWGFDYLKLDFLYAGAMRGRRFDPELTGNAAFRLGMLRLRAAAGARFLLGCGAPLVSSVGLVDAMRIGSDVAEFWSSAGQADGPSLRNAARATLARLWLHGRWWINDPDCVVIRSEATQLSLSEVQAWATVVALSGGMVLVGDDLAFVEESRLRLLARLLPPSGQAAQASGPLVGLLPEHLQLRVERAWGSWSVIAIANWSDAPIAAVFNPGAFSLEAGAHHVVDQWTGEYLGCHSGVLELGELGPHAIRLLTVHPDLGRPQTMGSTGHLLGDAMDLQAEAWDASSRTLSLTPTSTAPPARRGELLIADPWGPVRRIPFSPGDPPIHLTFG
jgi:alpha-galactosidase